MTPRRFPPSWSAEETDACFIVRDHGGQALASQGEVPTLTHYGSRAVWTGSSWAPGGAVPDRSNTAVRADNVVKQRDTRDRKLWSANLGREGCVPSQQGLRVLQAVCKAAGCYFEANYTPGPTLHRDPPLDNAPFLVSGFRGLIAWQRPRPLPGHPSFKASARKSRRGFDCFGH
jgi:hypothetical protein